MEDLRWIAYLDGELPAPQRAELERALAANTPQAEALRQQLSVARAVWEQVDRADRAPAAAWLDTARVWPGVLESVRPWTGPPRPAARWLPRAAFASTLAAGLTLGVALGFRFTRSAASDAEDLTEYTSLLSAPEGSVADLYFAQEGVDGAGTTLSDVSPAEPRAATSATQDSAGGLR